PDLALAADKQGCLCYQPPPKWKLYLIAVPYRETTFGQWRLNNFPIWPLRRLGMGPPSERI
ncbi:MAG: hypothetical protein ACPGWR_33195, partial [Ardenticatenaceae bacterium]